LTEAAPGAPVATTSIYVALVHHPVLDKHGDTVTTAITTLDLHDLGRLAATYDVARVLIVTPAPGQQELYERITKHWRTGWGAGYNDTRRRAFERLDLVATLADACRTIEENHGEPPWIVTTSARTGGRDVLTFGDLRTRLAQETRPALLVLGTGWGLHDSVLDMADALLEPIVGRTDYRHLSVRAAAAILLDRLLAPDRP